MVMKARINTERSLALFYTAALLTAPRVTVYSPDGTTTTITLTSSSTLANLYLPDELFTPVLTGEHILLFEHNDGGYVTVHSESLLVGLDPTTDFEVSSTEDFKVLLPETIVGDTISTVTADVLDYEDNVIETLTAAYNAPRAGYEATVSAIATEGSYYLVWYDDTAFVHYEELLGLIPKEYELVTLEVFTTEGSATVPHVGTTVLLSRISDEMPVAQEVTNSSGYVSFTVPPDDYYVTLEKSGVVYSTNNVEITVVDSSLELGNSFRLETAHFEPTFFPLAAAVNTAVLYASLYNFDGTPMRDTEILVSLEQGPGNFLGNIVFGNSLVVKTDKNGYVEFTLVQGITATATVMSHSLRRTFTVPASAGPHDLLSLMAAADDVFDIVTVDIPATPRRSI